MSALSDSLTAWAWEGVEFPGTDTATEGGHDSARHMAYGQRGADVETTGEKPKVFSVTIPLRNGIRWTGAERLYPETYLRLRAALSTPEGLLTHPTWGLVTAHLDSWKERIDPTRPDGLDLEVTWTEQRGEAEGLELTLARNASPDVAATVAAESADTSAVSVPGGAGLASVAEQVGAALDYLEGAVRTGADAVATYADVVTAVTERLEDPAGLVTAGHDTRVSLTRARAALVEAQARYLDAQGTLTLTEDMTLARAAVLAYGDASRAAELAERNAIDDVLLIPAGMVLVI